MCGIATSIYSIIRDDFGVEFFSHRQLHNWDHNDKFVFSIYEGNCKKSETTASLRIHFEFSYKYINARR